MTFSTTIVLCAVLLNFGCYSENIIVQTNSAVKCLSVNTFTTKGKIGDFQVVLDTVLNCPVGYVCDDKTNFPCILEKEITTTPAPTTEITTTPEPTTEITTTPAPTTMTTQPTEEPTLPTGPPECPSKGKSPGRTCQTYYECVPVWWWFQPEERKCPDGQHFSDATKNCIPAEQSNCKERPTARIKATRTPTTTSRSTTTRTTTKTTATTTKTTSKPPTIEPPNCEKSGCHRAPKCDQYYECLNVMWWIELVVRDCPQNQHYKPPGCACQPKEESQCSDVSK